jgi:hypothetical protein
MRMRMRMRMCVCRYVCVCVCVCICVCVSVYVYASQKQFSEMLLSTFPQPLMHTPSRHLALKARKQKIIFLPNIPCTHLSETLRSQQETRYHGNIHTYIYTYIYYTHTYTYAYIHTPLIPGGCVFMHNPFRHIVLTTRNRYHLSTT